MQQFTREREIYNQKNPYCTCNEFNILLNLISGEYKYITTEETILSQSKNIFVGQTKLYMKVSRHSPTIHHMSLYTTPVYNLISMDNNDTLIIGKNVIHLFSSNKKRITNTDGLWVNISDSILHVSNNLRHIDVYNLDLDIVISQKVFVKDFYKNSISSILIASLSYDKLLTVYEFEKEMHKRDSAILIMDDACIFSICKFHTGLYIIQYILTKSREFLCTAFQHNEIINTFTCLPISYTYVLCNHTIAFSNECFFILTTKNIQDIIEYKFSPLLYDSYSFYSCIPIVTREENVIYIKKESHTNYLCITKVSNLSTYERPIPDNNYNYIHYNEKDCIISIGTDDIVLEFDFFY